MTSKTTPEERAEWRIMTESGNPDNTTVSAGSGLPPTYILMKASIVDLLDDLEAAETALAEREKRVGSLEQRLSAQYSRNAEIEKKHDLLMHAAQHTYTVVKNLMSTPNG